MIDILFLDRRVNFSTPPTSSSTPTPTPTPHECMCSSLILTNPKAWFIVKMSIGIRKMYISFQS